MRKHCNKSLLKLVMGLFLFGLIFSCQRNPYRSSNRLYQVQSKAFAKHLREPPTNMGIDSVMPSPYWVGATNFNMRKPNFVIIHHTAQNSCEQTLKAFTMIKSQVSAHYVICKDGTVHHMLNDYLRAWHGGISKWGNLTDINSASIGIELDNNGLEPFPDAQIQSLIQVLKTLKTNYNIPVANFIGHGDIAPVRKNDPNVFFPWKALAERGFGQWWGDTTGVVVPASFNNLLALRIVGYDVRDSTAAIRAFKRHFVQDTCAIINEADRKILYKLSGVY